jgi:hypothetical protein
MKCSTHYTTVSLRFKYSRHVELLHLESEKLHDGNKKKYHFTLIRNFNRLVTKAVGAKSNAIIRRKCMVPFYTQETFDRHAYFCTNIQPRCVMPTDESYIIFFLNTTRSLRHPIVIYADLEALLVKEDDKSHHIPHSASFLVVDNDMKLKSELKGANIKVNPKLQLFRGEDCMDMFVQGIKDTVDEFVTKHQQFKKANMTKEDWDIHNNSKEMLDL